MPYRPNKPCGHPGCPELVPHGQKYCRKHRPVHMDEDRSKPSYGWYSSRWIGERKRYLQIHPLCVMCMKDGRYVKATDVDHVVPHRGDPQLFWDEGNWQALCHRCHSRKTRGEDHNPVYRY